MGRGVMFYANRFTNVVLGGGGVKGIAYIGVFDVMERMGFKPASLAGVSAGALAGAFAAAGYGAAGMWQVMEEFDFEAVQLDRIAKMVPAVERLMELSAVRGEAQEDLVMDFLSRNPSKYKSQISGDDTRGNILTNIVTFCKEGCLYDGDLLEDWVRRTLARRGVYTFGDLRGGRADAKNPRGYKMRMTGVDCNRAKVVVIPDDMEYYGIDPDDFEVAKAVRISTCVPFAFKPVELAAKMNNRIKTFNLVDGGVLDSFPHWLVDDTTLRTAGFKLNGGEHSFFSLATPQAILKTLISTVHDIGVPKNLPEPVFDIEAIDTTQVDFLDFNLSNEDKRYMFNAGKYSALRLFNKIQRGEFDNRRYVRPPFNWKS